jgi:hypothetical protein
LPREMPREMPRQEENGKLLDFFVEFENRNVIGGIY